MDDQASPSVKFSFDEADYVVDVEGWVRLLKKMQYLTVDTAGAAGVLQF